MFVEYGHSVVGAYLHLQFTPAYRRDIFCDPVLIRFCRWEFQRIAGKLDVEVEASAFGPDHTHLFISGWKNHSISELARRFKGGSSHYLRGTFWDRIKGKLWGCKFRSEGYFAETVGRITTGKMRHYIDRQQEKHWRNNNYRIYVEDTRKTKPANTTKRLRVRRPPIHRRVVHILVFP